MTKAQKQKRLAILLIFSFLTTIMLLIAWLNPLQKLQLQFSNSLYYERETDHPIVVVAIDDISLSDEYGLGRFQDWSRAYYATVIDNLQKYQPASIGLDIFFRSEAQGIKQLQLDNILQSENPLNELNNYNSENIHPEDLALKNVFEKYDNIVIASKIGIDDEMSVEDIIYRTNFLFPNIIFENTIFGNIVSISDLIGMVRTVFPMVSNLENGSLSFSLSNVLKYLNISNIESYQLENNKLILNIQNNGAYIIPLENYQLLINFTSKLINWSDQMVTNKKLKILSFSDVYYEEYPEGFDPNFIKDKIVLIGPYANTLDDNVATPISPETAMPGVLVHAQAIQTILDQAWLRNVSLWEQAVLIFVLIGGALYLTFYLRIRFALPILVVGLLMYYFVAAPLAFRQLGVILNLVYPPLALLAATLIVYIYRYLTEFNQRAFLHYAFSKYVDSSVIDQTIDDPTRLRVGGRKQDLTVIFTDIVGFTTIAEKLHPDSLVAMLNEYLDVMTQIIVRNGGVIDKFQGDAIMAFFEDTEAELLALDKRRKAYQAVLDRNPHLKMQPGNDFTEPGDHVYRAALSAVEMRGVLPLLMEKWSLDPPLPGGEKKPEIDFRVGVSTGEAVIGNMGSEDRLSYTVIGDIVNLGSRLESINKKYKTRIIVSEETYSRTKEKFCYRYADMIRVKGKTQAVKIYELIARGNEALPREIDLANRFHQAIQFYFERKFLDAYNRFLNILKDFPDDYLSELYAERCDLLRKEPPHEDWDFVYNMEQK